MQDTADYVSKIARLRDAERKAMLIKLRQSQVQICEIFLCLSSGGDRALANKILSFA